MIRYGETGENDKCNHILEAEKADAVSENVKQVATLEWLNDRLSGIAYVDQENTWDAKQRYATVSEMMSKGILIGNVSNTGTVPSWVRFGTVRLKYNIDYKFMVTHTGLNVYGELPIHVLFANKTNKHQQDVKFEKYSGRQQCGARVVVVKENTAAQTSNSYVDCEIWVKPQTYSNTSLHLVYSAHDTTPVINKMTPVGASTDDLPAEYTSTSTVPYSVKPVLMTEIETIA